MFSGISLNTKSNCYPSYMGKASKENGNVAKNSACNRRELLIHCPSALTRHSWHRSDCNSVSKLGRGRTLNRKEYYIALILNSIHKNPEKHQQPTSPKSHKTHQTNQLHSITSKKIPKPQK